MIKRKISRIETPTPHQGFLGPGHVARAVIQNNFTETDPFIMLMDDDVTVPEGEPVGGPHPHAGFETVTLILEGEIHGENVMKAGDFQMMTAGGGIIHAESLAPGTKLHGLQLWLTLPKKDRWITPRVQDMKAENVPHINKGGVEIRLYSGSMAGVMAPTLNHVPVIIADLKLQPGATTKQVIPAAFNTFIYVIEGSVQVGEERKILHKGQTGWLDILESDLESELELTASEEGARFVLYAGQPQHDKIVPYGPFIGDSINDISRLYTDFRQGKMQHVSTLPAAQKFSW